MIKIEELTHRFGDTLALDGISFEVGAGEVLGLLGPNGARTRPAGPRRRADGTDPDRGRLVGRDRRGLRILRLARHQTPPALALLER